MLHLFHRSQKDLQEGFLLSHPVYCLSQIDTSLSLSYYTLTPPLPYPVMQQLRFLRYHILLIRTRENVLFLYPLYQYMLPCKLSLFCLSLAFSSPQLRALGVHCEMVPKLQLYPRVIAGFLCVLFHV